MPSEDGVVGGLRICLIPANARACAISLTADHPPHIDLFLGPEPTITSYEFWRDDFAENLSLLRERLEAVVLAVTSRQSRLTSGTASR